MNASHLLTGVLCLLLAGHALAQQPERKYFGKNHPFALEELPAGQLKDKLQTLDPKARGKAMRWLHDITFPDFDAKHHLRVDDGGGIYIVCPEKGCEGCGGHHDHDDHDHDHDDHAPAESEISVESVEVESGKTSDSDPEVSATSVPISAPPVYNSKPGAPFHIYLDFNGAVVEGKQWNTSYGVTRWECLPWSLDSDRTTFSASEQTEMRRIWERIAEDYAPFNVNVTTDVTYDPDNYTGDKNKVGWLLITPTKDKNGVSCPHDGAGGVAYVNVFGRTDFFSKYQPAWVTPMGTANTAEAASHEMGHNMGLTHDGLTSGAEYYGGHAATTTAPSWGPIMGTGYNRNVSQWSKGEYYLGNQTQDDLAIIAGKITYRADDHGTTFGTATPWVTTPVNQPGIVERTSSPDFFTFNTAAGSISFNANTYRCDTQTWGGNLDILLELYNESQTLVASHNPGAETNASISTTVPAGRYYLVVRPTGAGDPFSTTPSGYTVYGSLGQYTITGNFIPEDGIFLNAPGGGESWIAGVTYDIIWGSAMGGNVKIELFKAGSLHTTIATSTPNNGSYAWAIPSGITLGNDYKVKITSIEQPTKSDQSASNFAITNDPLADALDTTGLIWTTSGNAPWFRQTTTTKDGVDAAQSGLITHNQTSAMQTTIVGPGTMTFWWKVSSETNYDFLRFFLNGIEQTGSLARISGNVDWVQRTVNIPTGSNVVEWRYTKDGSVDANADAAWVDQVVFTPASSPLIVVEQPAGTGLTDGASTVDFGSVNVGSSSERTFTIRNDGTADLTGLALSKSGTHGADFALGSIGATTLAPGGSTTFTVTFTPGAAGTRTAALQIASNDEIRNPFDINLTGNGLGPGALDVTGTDGLNASGNHGGPFSPSSLQYTLSNPGGTSIGWTAAKTAGWVTLSATSGTLASGASTTVTVSINSNANTLNAGSYNDTVTFTNTTNGSGNTTRTVALRVNTPPLVDAGPHQTVFFTGEDWSPHQIAPELWLDASDTATITLNSGKVSQWADKSGKNRHATRGTTTDQPTYQASDPLMNNLPSIGSNSRSNSVGLDTPSMSAKNVYAVTYNATGENTTFGGYAALFSGPGTNSEFRVMGNSGTSSFITTNRFNDQTFKNGATVSSDVVLPMPASVFKFKSNTSRTQVYSLGYFKTSAGRTWDGYYSEFIFTDGNEDAATEQKIEGYLAHKWGLAASLPAGHLYKSESPNNASAIASLAGAASDADGDDLVTTWSVVSGPGQVNFANINALETTASFSAEGIYTLRLTANDGYTETSDEVVITVEPAPAGFTVRYQGNGNTGGAVPVDGANYNENDTVTVLDNTGSLTRTGYIFEGWNTTANGSGTSYQPGASFQITDNVNLYAQWAANAYTVTFDANGGDSPSLISKSVTYDSAYGALATVNRIGYAFRGWFTAASGGTEVTDATIVAIAGNHTLYAQWEANSYTVTFDPNGGGTPSPTSKSVSFDATYGTLASVARTGHTFSGWFTAASGGSLVTDSTFVTATANHTLYAQWAVNTYTVSYDGNEATSGTAPSNQTKTYDVNLTLASNSGGLARAGYTFAGWNTAADGGGTSYGEAATYTANADVALFAKWTANTYTVTFDPNGGEAPVPASKLVTYGSSYDVLATTTRDGHSFNGWFTAPSGGSLITTGTPVAIDANHTLYAQWTELIVEMDVSRNATAIALGGYDALEGSAVGAGAKLNYDITNGGTDTLTLGSAVISNETNCVVLIDSQPTASVLPSNLTGLVLTATPASAGAWSFTVTIANNHPEKNPYQWTVHGVASSSATVVLTAVADTWINAASTGSNYGTDTSFSIFDRTQGQSNLRRFGLLRFDLSGIPSTATITSASLGLVQSNTNAGLVNIVNITNSWTETGATWTNANNLVGNTSYGSESAPGTENGSVPSIVLNSAGLDMVRSWVTTPATNYGFGVKTTNTGNNTNIDLHSGEATNSAHHPKLSVTYAVDPQIAKMHVTRDGSVLTDDGTDSVSGTMVETTTQLTYEIVNLGNADLSITTPVTISSATNCTVQVNSQPAGTMAASTGTQLVVTVTPTSAGDWSVMVSIANNDTAPDAFNWTIHGSATGGGMTYDVWVDGFFDNPLEDPAPDADPDGDGLTNLQEFAFGTDPTAGWPGVLAFVPGGDVTRTGVPLLMDAAAAPGHPPFQAVYGRRKNHVVAGLIYRVEFSADLATWTHRLDGHTVLTGENPGSDIEVVGVPFPESVPVSSGPEQAPKFFRVGVSEAAP
ncbi:MAG: InlB B-repeat-containing protein [Luteolibacter sp.]